MYNLTIRTGAREEFVSIGQQLKDAVAENGWRDGALALFCPHTTAALTVNENADPSVASDIVRALGRLAPRSGDYRHAEGNSDAHIKTVLTGPSLLVLVSGGQIQLGNWQGVFLCEYDGPRTRRVWLMWLPGE